MKTSNWSSLFPRNSAWRGWRTMAFLPAFVAAMPLWGCEYYDFGDAPNGTPGHGHGHGGKSCEVDGTRHRVGESFPSSDGCNRCWCEEDGSLSCTTMLCVATCGGIAGLPCPDEQYCDFPPKAACGAGDQTGFCAEKPTACTKEFAPVCGCDGATYSNACVAAAAGVSVLFEGECRSGVRPLQLGEACGGFRPPGAPACDKGLFCQHQPGALCGAADAPGECVAIPELCPDVFAPVCGCDGKTYGNACEAAANQAGILERGECQ